MSVSTWWKSVAVGSVAALTLAAGLSITAAPAFAQTDDTEPTAPPSGIMEWGQRGHRGGPGGFLGGFHGGATGDRAEALAEQLGITVEELEAAQQALRDEALANAIADGTITQEQVDLMEAAQALRESIDNQAILAEALGISVEELEAAQEAGTLRDLMADVDREALQESIQAATDAAIAQAVADGVITQEQADQLSEAGKGFGGRGFKGGMIGGEGFERGPRGDRFGAPDTQTESGEGL